MFRPMYQTSPAEIRDLLETLPEKNKNILILRFLENNSIFEISKKMRTSWDKTDRLINESLQILRDRLLLKPQVTNPSLNPPQNPNQNTTKKKKGPEMENQTERPKFVIYTGRHDRGEVLYERPAGDAYLFDEGDKPYYLIKMWAFPDQEFYLCKNHNSLSRYTLFSKQIEEEDQIIFQRPIGHGLTCPELKDYLQLQFNFPRQRVYMSLFPDESSQTPRRSEDTELTDDSGIESQSTETESAA